jgi:hypothetical protein
LLRFLMICGLALFSLADNAFAEGSNIGSVATNVTTDLSGLGKTLTIPAYARGVAMEVKSVVELKRQHRTDVSQESGPTFRTGT